MTYSLWVKTREEHISTLEEVLKQLEKEGLKSSKDKCRYLVKTVEYLGFKIDANGLHATGQELDTLLEAPIPTSVQQLRSFLGLVNYYSKFIPNLATILHPFNALLKKNAQWKWSEECEHAFNGPFINYVTHKGGGRGSGQLGRFVTGWGGGGG